jgi:outer membrane receptor protein involved in Fe transport
VVAARSRRDGADRSLSGKSGEHVSLVTRRAGLAGAFDASGIQGGLGGDATDGRRNLGGGAGLGGDRRRLGRRRGGGSGRGGWNLWRRERQEPRAHCRVRLAGLDRSDYLTDDDVGRRRSTTMVIFPSTSAVPSEDASAWFVGEERLTLADGRHRTRTSQARPRRPPVMDSPMGGIFDFDGHESWVGINLEPIPRPFNGE